MQTVMVDSIRLPRPVEPATPIVKTMAPKLNSAARPGIAVITGALVLSLVILTDATGLSLTITQVPTQAQAAIPAPQPPPPPQPQPAVAPAAVAQPDPGGLQKLLDAFAAAQPATFGIVVKDLKTGAEASRNASQSFKAASLYKLFVARAIYSRIEHGSLKLTDSAGGGTGRTIAGCLQVMINVSDNACGWALGNIIGWGRENDPLHQLGYTGTSLSGAYPLTTARDVATLLEREYTGTLLAPPDGQQFLALLKDQRVNNRLPVGLPPGTVIAHKTGDLEGVVHDAGIVYAPKTDYLITVLSGPWPNSAAAPAAFADLSARLYDYFKQ